MKMNKAYIDQECVMCQTYGNFLQKRSSQISIKNQLELSKEDIENSKKTETSISNNSLEKKVLDKIKN